LVKLVMVMNAKGSSVSATSAAMDTTGWPANDSPTADAGVDDDTDVAGCANAAQVTPSVPSARVAAMSPRRCRMVCDDEGEWPTVNPRAAIGRSEQP
jgi:hypothetical protein